MGKELEYIIKRKNKIGKKMDKDQNLLECCGEYKSSDKQWFGWCEEYETLQSIEKELKRLEEIDRWKANYNIESDEELLRFIHNGWYFEVKGEKELKALKIIKEKGVSLWTLKNSNNVEQYNDTRNCCIYDSFAFVKELTQEEYDLLREVLL